MKTKSWGLFLLLTLSASSLLAQGLPSLSQSAAGAARTPAYTVKERGPHHRVWQWTETETGADGMPVEKVHSYVELATGLNYRDEKTGEWRDSKAEIGLLPNGAGAAASQGQHKAIFPPTSAGIIELNTPEGKWLRSQVLGLAYFDTSTGTNVLIAELKESQGEVHSPNVVIYPDSFTDIKADLRYTYTLAGFEQDIVLHEKPPGPEEWGLNPATTRLQVLTEFINPPQPTTKVETIRGVRGEAMSDKTVGFESMMIGRGKAFSADRQEKSFPVGKDWLKLDGRDFLIEELPVDDLQEELNLLPQGASIKSKSGSLKRTASVKRSLPERKLAQTSGTKEMKLASLSVPKEKGFVLDYVTLNTSLSGYTFQGDTTYYISGTVNITGSSTFEGGTVIKYATNSQLVVGYPPNWLASAYRPVILTAQDDNTVGETISGSTGVPSGSYASCALVFGYSPTTISNFRISYAATAVTLNSGGNPVFSNGQLLNCGYGFNFASGSSYINLKTRNLLLANTMVGFCGISAYSSVDAQNATFSSIYALVSNPQYYSSLSLKNCILATVNNLGMTPAGNNNGFYRSPNFGTSTFTNTFSPFQTVGAGSYYLAGGGNFFNVGTTNIDSTLLGDLRKKTTYPPLVYTNVTVNTDTVLAPQAQRDTDLPDLGYHYDPIDYITASYMVTNATLTIGSGTAIGYYFDSAPIWLKEGSSIVSVGSPLAPNWFVRYTAVQEQPVTIGTSVQMPVNPYHTGTPAPNALFRFSKFSIPAGPGYQIYHNQGLWTYGNLQVQDCEFWNGQNYLAGTTNTTAVFKNNLFDRCVINAMNYASSTNVTLSFSNNLFWSCTNMTIRPMSNTNSWFVFNNSFDNCNFSAINPVCGISGYNAYIHCNKQLNPTNASDIALTSFTYASGKLGDFYQSTTNLINRGSVTANLTALYHYTTQTNQVKESNTQVDIGYHYVAVDSAGNLIDTDGDGIPDYLEDSNGNGISDSGDLGNWTASENGTVGFTNGQKILLFEPKPTSQIP